MVKEATLERYLDVLLKGDRRASQGVIEEALQTRVPANRVYVDIIWPIMVEIEQLYRTGKIDSAQEHLATRINRTIVDQLQNKLPRKAGRGKKIVVCCAPDEPVELGAQMMADLFESDGWDVRFLGGGVNNDDILSFVHEYGTDVLLVYGTTPHGGPDVRRLIDTIRDVNALPNMRIMLSGGLFNRAEGLWEEIGADLFAATASEAVEIASNSDERRFEAKRTINCRKKRRPCKRDISAAENMV